MSGGTFEGAKLKGTVLPGGDWIIRRPDGSSVLDVRIILQTSATARRSYMTRRGDQLTTPEEAAAQYWRIAPAFDDGG